MLLDVLKQEQKTRGLRDVDFAALLGVPRSTWANARLGIRPLNNRIVRGTMRAFPDLHGTALAFLVSDSTNGNKRSTTVKTGTTASEPALRGTRA